MKQDGTLHDPLSPERARQPAGHRPVIEPGEKIVTVGRTEWPQAVCLVYLYVHRRKMKAVT